MKAKFDGEQITLSKDFVAALISVMKAESAMMAKRDGGAEMWYWGRCKIQDLGNANCLEITYGSRDDMPKDRRGRFAVLAAG